MCLNIEHDLGNYIYNSEVIKIVFGKNQAKKNDESILGGIFIRNFHDLIGININDIKGLLTIWQLYHQLRD